MVITAVYESAAMEAVSNNIIHLLNFNFHLLKFIIYHTTLNLHTCFIMHSNACWEVKAHDKIKFPHSTCILFEIMRLS